MHTGQTCPDNRGLGALNPCCSPWEDGARQDGPSAPGCRGCEEWRDAAGRVRAALSALSAHLGPGPAGVGRAAAPWPARAGPPPPDAPAGSESAAALLVDLAAFERLVLGPAAGGHNIGAAGAELDRGKAPRWPPGDGGWTLQGATVPGRPPPGDRLWAGWAGRAAPGVVAANASPIPRRQGFAGDGAGGPTTQRVVVVREYC